MTLESDIKKLIEVGLLADDGALIVTNFASRQGPTQEDKRKQWSERQKKHRERVKKSNVTSESRVSHADVTLLEEEKRERKSINTNGAKNAPSHEKYANQQKRNALIGYFQSLRPLSIPSDIKAKQKLWWSPADEILKMVDYNEDEARKIVDRAIQKMGNLTISDMNSIIKTARAVHAEEHKTDTKNYAESY